jgi:hypothetical protein
VISLTFTAVILPFAGCGDADSPDVSADGAWAGSMSDSAGITLVANPPRGLWTESDAWVLDGRYLGEVDLPPGFELFRIRGDRLYGLRRDEFDFPRIMRFRLERGTASGEERPPPR